MAKDNFTLPINLFSSSFEQLMHTRQTDFHGWIAQVAFGIASDTSKEILDRTIETATDEIAKNFAKYFLEGAGRNIIRNSVETTFRCVMPAVDILAEVEKNSEPAEEDYLVLQKNVADDEKNSYHRT
jgi:hypothetical protein